MDLLLLLQEIRQPWLSVLLKYLVIAFNDGGVILALTWLYWCYDKRLARTVALSFIGSASTIQFLKIIIRIPRPWVLDPRIIPDPLAAAGATGFSCPSGHSQTASAVGYSFGLQLRRWRWAFFMMPFVVMFSRLYFGVHTLTDVLLGWAIGLALSAACFLCRGRQADLWLEAVMLVIALAGSIYAYYSLGSGLSFADINDTIRSCGLGIGYLAGSIFEQSQIGFIPQPGLKKGGLAFLGGIIPAGALYLAARPWLTENFWLTWITYLMIGLWISGLYPWILSRKEKKRPVQD